VRLQIPIPPKKPNALLLHNKRSAAAGSALGRREEEREEERERENEREIGARFGLLLSLVFSKRVVASVLFFSFFFEVFRRFAILEIFTFFLLLLASSSLAFLLGKKETLHHPPRDRTESSRTERETERERKGRQFETNLERYALCVVFFLNKTRETRERERTNT